MRRKIFGAVLMAACLPIALQAADITVVKETPIAVGERISTTASFASDGQTRDSERKSRGLDIPTSTIGKPLRDKSHK